MQRQAPFFFDDAPAPPAGPFHTFNGTAGGSGSPGFNRGNYGTIDSGEEDWVTPSGTSVEIRHCRIVGSGINFALLTQDVAYADFPTRVVLANLQDNVVVTMLRPGSVRNISGATRGDYTVAPSGQQVAKDGFTIGALASVLQSGERFSADLYYD